MIESEIDNFNDDFIGTCQVNGRTLKIADSVIGDVYSIDFKDKKIYSVDRIEDSIYRSEPECIHYNDCGGCNKQYIREDRYLFYKNQILDNILKELGFSDILSVPVNVGRYSRRRTSFKIIGGSIGYYKEKSHDVFSIKSCLILDQRILNIVELIRKFPQNIISNITDIDINIADNGPDILFYIKRNFSVEEIEYINIFAKKNDIIRINVSYRNILTPLIIIEIPFLLLGNYIVELPEMNFLQATDYSQKYIVDLIIYYLKNNLNIADLYSGIGTYSFPLSEFCKIDMFEGNEYVADPIRKLKNDKIKLSIRNLHNNPLSSDEINKYDAIIINPPRNGASRQISQIAGSKLKKLIMIYCNHKTFKRDVLILIEFGFKIKFAKLIDQFHYTNHFEIFSYLER